MNERTRSFLTPALVIKRSNTGEADRVVTLLTQKMGKVICIAKGVRKIKSSKRAYLEPGNHIQAFLIKTKSMPLLTQARLVDDFPQTKIDLKRMRQLSQVLEIVDKLFVEGEEDQQLFEEVLEIIQHLSSPSSFSNSSSIRNKLAKIIQSLGYYDEIDSKSSLLELVSEISDRPMRSWEYLKI